MSSSELQALFSNLKPRPRDSSSSANPQVSYSSPQATASFLSNAQLPSTPPPPFTATDNSARMFGHTSQQAPTQNDATAQNLLNLLNFGRTNDAGKDAPQTSATHTAPSVSASDLVARFMSPTGSRPDAKLESTAPVSTNAQSHIHSSRNPLLDLLNRQAIAEERSEHRSDHQQSLEEDRGIVKSIETDQPVRPDEIMHNTPSAGGQFTFSGSREHTPADLRNTASPAPSKPIFTYQNPFEALQASRGQSAHKSHSPAPFQSNNSVFASAENGDVGSTPVAISARKKLTPKLRSQRSGTSPQLESNFQVDEGQTSPTPFAHGSLTVRDKQPTVEAPETAEPVEVAKEDIVADERSAQQDQEQGHEQEVDEMVQDAQDAQDGQDASGDWEDVPERSSDARVVPVYNFPIKAFVSITLQFGPESHIGIRHDGVMEISRLKKDFDQLDRSLAAATSRYITYAFTKNGGVRIIRQDDGSDRHVFKHTHDRVFNVSFCTTAIAAPPTDNQAVLGTGVSGTVYYATVSKEGNDLFEKNQLDAESLIFPPWPQADENTAGGVLKTRAKRSSRHPEFFAIGRGKSIHLIWPATAMSPKYGISETNRVVDIEKLYQDRPLQISTGKAGKDFTFSEDDTMIVSLDKTGRLRFWDIRHLVDESNATAARVSSINIEAPVLSLSTASPAEKSWPTSVIFVDKARPYNKGGAQRYVLVGLRQNHTLQLWDIALGKAVQELNFPHSNETDGICSVNYHPTSGIIVVGHPTRNSIFFIHLSAPRYVLGSVMTQADYVGKTASKDMSLPKPESTACMSGIREMSFASKGELRSIELLTIHKGPENLKDSADSSPVFELYVVHSKGVTCLAISKEDLGWNSDSKVIDARDALKEGLVTLKDLKLGSVIEEATRSKSPVKEIVQQPAKPSKKKAKKAGQSTEEIVNGVEGQTEPVQADNLESSAVTDQLQSDTMVGDAKPIHQEVKPIKETKKNKKKAAQATNIDNTVSQDTNQAASPTKSSLDSTIRSVGAGTDTSGPRNQEAEQAMSRISQELLEQEMKKIENSLSESFKTQLDALYHNIHEDRSAQDQVASSRHETVLRIVSDSLTNNVEKSLGRIVSQQIQHTVVPVVAQSASAEIGDTLSKSLNQIIPQEVNKHLPTAVSTALQSAHMIRTISDSVSQKLTKQIQSQIPDIIKNALTPVLKAVADASAARATAEVETRVNAQLQQFQMLHAEDSQKIDQLNQAMQGMISTLQTMSNTQVAFQAQILKDRRETPSVESTSNVTGSRQVSTARASPALTTIARPIIARIKSKAEIELDEVTSIMTDGKYEEATIKWLQSSQPAKIFDEVFIRFTPDYLLTDVSPLVAFSVAVTLGNSLNTNAEERIEWMSTAFDAVDPADSELVDLASHAPSLITSVIQKLESLYMVLAEQGSGDPVLKAIPALAKKARELRAVFHAPGFGN